MKPTHIYWFCYFGADEPSVRYRAQYPLWMLKEKFGVRCTLVMPGYTPAAIVRFVLVFLRVVLFRTSGSLIVFQKLHTGRAYATALKAVLRLQPRATVYDTDDADYLRFPVATIHHFAARCAACTVGSRALQGYFARLNPRTSVLTSPVIWHPFAKAARGAVFTVGWIGYWCDHRDSLTDLAFPGIRALTFPVRLVLVGMPDAAAVAEAESAFAGCPHVAVECPMDIDWLDEDSIYRRIAAFDAGLAPLLDTEMNRAKSAFKAKQYRSCGVPVLASAVGENAVFIRHGVNGFVCDGPEDYAARLAELAAMPNAAYSALSARARASVDEFSTEHYCRELLRIAADVL